MVTTNKVFETITYLIKQTKSIFNKENTGKKLKTVKIAV